MYGREPRRWSPWGSLVRGCRNLRCVLGGTALLMSAPAGKDCRQQFVRHRSVQAQTERGLIDGPKVVGDQGGIVFLPPTSQLTALNTVVGAGLREGCHPECYTPPPKFSAQPFSVGRFRFQIPQSTRGSRAFCVCQGVVRLGARGGQFGSFLPSVLSKSPPTFLP